MSLTIFFQTGSPGRCFLCLLQFQNLKVTPMTGPCITASIS